MSWEQCSRKSDGMWKGPGVEECLLGGKIEVGNFAGAEKSGEWWEMSSGREVSVG